MSGALIGSGVIGREDGGLEPELVRCSSSGSLEPGSDGAEPAGPVIIDCIYTDTNKAKNYQKKQ